MLDYHTGRYHLGKTPASHSVSFLWDTFFDSTKLPAVPQHRFGHDSLINSNYWGELGNDQVGCCVWSGAAHEDMLFNAIGGTIIRYNTRDVLSDYSAVTGYIRGRDDTDVGTDMGVAAKYRRKTGILAADGSRQTVDAYVALDPGNLTQIKLACMLFGACGIGVQLPSNAMQQFTDGVPWSLQPGSTTIGGHYVPCVGVNSAGNFKLVTWGRIHAATPSWMSERMDEGIAYLDLAVLDRIKKISPEGYDEQKLRTYLAAL